MKHRCPISFAACALLLVITTGLPAQDEAKTHEVKSEFFQVVETVTATVESRDMHAQAADTENWTTLKIKSIIPDGTRVKAGDVIVEFDREAIDQKIRETRQSLELTNLNLQGTELEMEQLDKTLPLDQTLAERSVRNAEQDYKYFNEVEKPNRERTVRRNVENSQHSLEYSTEEYDQLKRMYEEDELTEESEEIVLKRTQRDVENRQFFLEQAQIRAARSLDYVLPREMESKLDQLERSRLEHERSMVTLPLERQKKRVELEKARIASEKDSKDLKKLLADLDRMTIQAAAEGVVYYGRCERGKWLGQSGPKRNLEPGGTAIHDKTLVTVVNPDNLMLRADLTEKQLGSIRSGSQGLGTPVAFPDAPIPVLVTGVVMVPVAADKFDCQMEMPEPVAGLMPGMSCKVLFQIHRNDQALTVPESAVFSDDGISHYVFVAGDGEDAKPERRDVSTGLTSDSKTEITDGITAGEKVLLARPTN